MFRKIFAVAALTAVASTPALAAGDLGFETSNGSDWVAFGGTISGVSSYSFNLVDNAAGNDPVLSGSWSAAWGSKFGLITIPDAPSSTSETPVSDSAHFWVSPGIATKAGDQIAFRFMSADDIYSSLGYLDSVTFVMTGTYSGSYSYTFDTATLTALALPGTSYPDTQWMTFTFVDAASQPGGLIDSTLYAPAGTTGIAVLMNNYYDKYGSNTPVAAIDFQAAAVPEPESYAMMLAGLGVLGALARRRARKQA